MHTSTLTLWPSMLYDDDHDMIIWWSSYNYVVIITGGYSLQLLLLDDSLPAPLCSGSNRGGQTLKFMLIWVNSVWQQGHTNCQKERKNSYWSSSVGLLQEECNCSHPLLTSLANSDQMRACKLTRETGDDVSQNDTTCIMRCLTVFNSFTFMMIWYFMRWLFE